MPAQTKSAKSNASIAVIGTDIGKTTSRAFAPVKLNKQPLLSRCFRRHLSKRGTLVGASRACEELCVRGLLGNCPGLC